MKYNNVSKEQLLYLKRHQRNRYIVVFCQLLLGIAFLSWWEIATRFEKINPFIFSSPSRIFKLTISMIKDKSLFVHLGVTIFETLISFFLIMVIGLIIAVILWYTKTLSDILEPYLVMLGSLPKTALAPVLIVWLGNNLKTIIVAAVSVAVFGTIITLHQNFRETPPDMILLITTLGGTKKDVLTKVILPSSLPLIISTSKVNIGLSLVGVIIGEFLASNRGLGYLIIYGSQVFKLDLVIMSIILLCILSICLYGIIHFIEKRVYKL